MRRLWLLMVVCCTGLSSVHASDAETGKSVCEALQDTTGPVGKTLALEQLPRGVVCDDDAASTCPSAGRLTWIGRTDSGTRFWADTTEAPSGIRHSITLETLRKVESAFPDFRRSRGIDPSESVIRVYDEDGKGYEERKIRFGSIPRDFLLDLQRRAEKAETRSTIDGGTVDLINSGSSAFYTPIQVDSSLRVSNPCLN
jgi:hypothetical protein